MSTFLAVALAILVALALLKLHTAFWAGYFAIERSGDQIHFADTDDGLRIAVHRYLPRVLKYRQAVFLCHGMGANRYSFDLRDDRSLARELCGRGFDVWSVELRGCGFSGRPKWYAPQRWKYTFEDYLQRDLRAALALVRRVTADAPLFFVGHSMGGLLGYAWLGLRGDHGLAGLVTVSAPVLVGESRSIRRLQPLIWLLATHRVVAFRPVARFVSPFVGWGPGYISRLAVSPGGMEGALLRRCMVNLVENSTAAVLRQFIRWCRTNRLSLGENDYLDNLANIVEPVLILAADQDRVAAPPAVIPAYERIASEDKHLRVFGSERGDDSDFGHGDILLGQHAPETVFPEIVSWLESRATAIPGPGV